MAIEQQPTITLDLAQKIAQAAQEKARSLGLKMSIAIVNDAGNLIHFVSMDGARSLSIEVAQKKAKAAGGLRLSTRDVMARNTAEVGYAYNNFNDVVLLPGGLPIATATGAPLGAIGISGASGDQDETCAQAGLTLYLRC